MTKTVRSLDAALKIVLKGKENQAEAARQFGIGKAYLSRLLSGAKENPSDEVLQRMGITREVSVKYTVAVPL